DVRGLGIITSWGDFNAVLDVMTPVPGWVPDFEDDGEEGYDVNDGSYEDDMYGVYRKTLKMWKVKVIGKKFMRQTLRKYMTKVSLKETLLCRMMFIMNIRLEDGVCVGQHVHERVEVSNDTHESTCSGHFKKSEVPRKGGSILELIDDLVNVGQTMGYDMT
nr:RNA-directed DNA polymerase, eukaryota, reverse transcriptase zinc-binding domain protein [Tanacetum cinerariifolium]